MTFRIANSAIKANMPRPIMLMRGSHLGESGVFARVQQSNMRLATYFYPANVIIKQVDAKGGRDGYVYKEGFDVWRQLEDMRTIINMEIPKWRGGLMLDPNVNVENLLITQPGVDVWRMLCFALDHGQTESSTQSPVQFLSGPGADPVFGLIGGNYGKPILQAGNHRALFAFINQVPTLTMQKVVIPIRAMNYQMRIDGSISYIESIFSTQGVLALARSFMQQIDQLD